MNCIYLDYNATTPIDKEVVDFMIPLLRENFGNPSSLHQFGIAGRKIVENARFQLAEFIHCKPYEIIFTSGGTESNNIAIQGIALASRNKGNHIITSSIEHPSVLEVCRYLEKNGFRISYIGVDRKGRIDPDDVRAEILPETILVSIMHANNETGVIQPIQEISDITREFNIPFHTDAAQSAGKIEVDVQKMGVDLLTIAGHKLYAPKGIGALFIREGIEISKILHGADHEHNLRPGTENVLEIAALGKAAEIAIRDMEKNSSWMKKNRDLLFAELKGSLPELIWNGDQQNMLPNTLNLSFPGLNAHTLLSEIEGVAASAGAACHAEHKEISHVLNAMEVSPSLAIGTIRFSTGKYNTSAEIKKAAEIISKSAKKLMNPSRERNAMFHSSQFRLTQFTHGMGCACKISPAVLEDILKNFTGTRHPDIIVGTDTSDDAAVYKISENQAVVQTVDFFTPIVDDPFEFGAIAASNALSDIYAMGADPLFALNIVAFPTKRLPLHVLSQILNGAKSVADEAGIFILGGHTIEDNEPKFGMAVSGIIHPDKVIRNSTAQAGHDLILTKPIGTGILSSALKRGLLDLEKEKLLYKTMRTLNKRASLIMRKYGVSACTDVTGFGLSGHLKEIIEFSGKGAEIYPSEIPVLPGSFEFAAQGVIPGGSHNNLAFVDETMIYSDPINYNMKIILSDAQTSGGLLIAIDPNDSPEFLREFNSSENHHAVIIGKITDANKGKILTKSKPF